jgi:hypothetical protein
MKKKIEKFVSSPEPNFKNSCKIVEKLRKAQIWFANRFWLSSGIAEV